MDQPDESVWPYIHCGICHNLFQRSREPTGAPSVPFWLTECGHVVCNSHLRSDKACAQCGANDIQVVSLQYNLDPPMSDWFRPLPYALDAIAHAAKFQMHMITTLLQAYKSKCLKQRQLIDSLRAEIDGYKRELDARDAAPNSNGKRPRLDYPPSAGPSSQGLRTPTMQYQQPQGPARTYYDPPPVQPAEPPMQHPQRPESRFDNFAFHPPPEQHGPPARTAPIRVAQQGPGAWSSTPLPQQPPSRQQMPPPAAPRFRPAPPPPAPTPGARAAFYGAATPSINRTGSVAPGRQRFAPGGGSFRQTG